MRRTRISDAATPAASALALAGLLALGAPAPVSAQQSAPDACAAEEHRHFDFWIGEWRVENPDGEEVGANTISRISEGCALLEEWVSARGVSGNSVNFYDPERESWNQVWVGGEGTILRLEGGLSADGEMVLTGREERELRRGRVLDRITWTPMSGGRVEQRWDLSSDGGESWETVFRGIYVPREAR